MLCRSFCVALCLAGSTAVTAAPAVSDVPKPLLAQVQRLTDLLRDGYAVGYPAATMVQTLRYGFDQTLALTVFTVEGYGGGNNHTQYLAVFDVGADAAGLSHYRLLDTLKIGGKAWRAVMHLDARVVSTTASGGTVIVLDALENSAGDAAGFPSKPVRITLLLDGGRLVEQARP